MNVLSRIWFPATVLAAAVAGAFGFGSREIVTRHIPDPLPVIDTVVYTKDANAIPGLKPVDQRIASGFKVMKSW